jgi:hypothetical protein
MEISQKDVLSLTEKLNALELTDEEREVLGHLLVHDEDEVQGFRDAEYLKDLPPVQGFNIGMPPTRGFNIGMPPTKSFNIGMPPT